MARTDLTRQIIDAWEAAEPGPTDTATRRAEIARDLIGSWLEMFADSLDSACQRLRHRGSRPATASSKGTSCLVCRAKAAHFRAAARYVAARTDQ